MKEKITYSVKNNLVLLNNNIIEATLNIENLYKKEPTTYSSLKGPLNLYRCASKLNKSVPEKNWIVVSIKTKEFINIADNNKNLINFLWFNSILENDHIEKKNKPWNKNDIVLLIDDWKSIAVKDTKIQYVTKIKKLNIINFSFLFLINKIVLSKFNNTNNREKIFSKAEPKINKLG